MTSEQTGPNHTGHIELAWHLQRYYALSTIPLTWLDDQGRILLRLGPPLPDQTQAGFGKMVD